MNKSQIIGVLPKLTRPELEEIQAVITNLLGGRIGNVSKGANTLAPMVFDAISAALNQRAMLEIMPDSLQQRFNRQLPLFLELMNTSFPKWDKNKLKQISILRLLFQFLKDELSDAGIRPTYNTMINNLHRMGEVFDNAFPDYREAGHAMKVFRGLGNGPPPAKKNRESDT